MQSAGRRAATETRMSSTWPAPDRDVGSFVVPPDEPMVRDPDARWNWWISNHGTLIAATLVVLALSMLAVLIVHDRTETAPPTTTAAPAPSGKAPTTLTLPPLTTQGAVSAVNPASGVTTTSSRPATALSEPTTAAPSTVRTTVVETDPPTTALPTTIRTTPAPTTTAPTTAAPPTAPPPTPAALATDRTAALVLPHLQATDLPAGWVQVARRITSNPSQPTSGAASFRWAGPHDTTALLQLADASQPPTFDRKVTVRGHQANVTVSGPDISVQWSEGAGLGVRLRTHGLSETDAIAVANKLSSLSDSDWSKLVQRCKSVTPISWDRILIEDW
jgi:hypothetical protein